MSTHVYLYSYPKTSVSERVQWDWNHNKPVSHILHVYEEVEGNADVLEWSAKYGFCMEALRAISPKNTDGVYDGDLEFPVSRELLAKFKADIERLDVTPETDDEWTKKSLAQLQALIDGFDFEAKYLTIHTD